MNADWKLVEKHTQQKGRKPLITHNTEYATNDAHIESGDRTNEVTSACRRRSEKATLLHAKAARTKKTAKENCWRCHDMSQQEPQLVFRSMYMSRYVTWRICHNMSHGYKYARWRWKSGAICALAMQRVRCTRNCEEWRLQPLASIKRGHLLTR